MQQSHAAEPFDHEQISLSFLMWFIECQYIVITRSINFNIYNNSEGQQNSSDVHTRHAYTVQTIQQLQNKVQICSLQKYV